VSHSLLYGESFSKPCSQKAIDQKEHFEVSWVYIQNTVTLVKIKCSP
jgi:hypothetical protein